MWRGVVMWSDGVLRSDGQLWSGVVLWRGVVLWSDVTVGGPRTSPRANAQANNKRVSDQNGCGLFTT